MLQKLVINKIINFLSMKFKLFKVLKYVEEPNELDHKVLELENKILKLEAYKSRIEKIEKGLELFKK